MSRAARGGAAALAVGLVVATTGCSQVAQLRGVAGDQVTAVRTATNDVLVEQGVDIGIAPVCAADDPVYTCTGSTSDGQPITAEARVVAEFGATTDQYGADRPADVSLVVRVGGSEVFSGTVADVIARSGEVAP